jgi:hypothetical protein
VAVVEVPKQEIQMVMATAVMDYLLTIVGAMQLQQVKI